MYDGTVGGYVLCHAILWVSAFVAVFWIIASVFSIFNLVCSSQLNTGILTYNVPRLTNLTKKFNLRIQLKLTLCFFFLDLQKDLKNQFQLKWTFKIEIGSWKCLNGTESVLLTLLCHCHAQSRHSHQLVSFSSRSDFLVFLYNWFRHF